MHAIRWQGAGRDINSASTTVSNGQRRHQRDQHQPECASMSVSETNGSLTAVAGRDINLKASGTSADNVTLVAYDVSLSTRHETSQEKIAWDGDNRAEVNRSNAIGSTVQGKNIGITAGRDINSQAAYVNADGASATAGNINIGTDVSSASARDQHKKSDSGGMLASRTVTTDDSSSQAINQGTTFRQYGSSACR
jgi:filamentous hemagglutinin